MAKETNSDNKRKDNSRRNRSHPRSPAMRREKRREEAIERQKAYDALTTEEKIARLPRGGGHSLRELRRLRVPIEG